LPVGEGGRVRVVCLTDTHHQFESLRVPDGDLLLHAGDHSRRGTVEELLAASQWLRALPHRHKVILAGNHDFCLREAGTTGPEMFEGMTYLLDQATEVEGLRIYGSPWTPKFGGEWAYQVQRGQELAKIWERIPDNTQLLITHGPPAGIGDLTLRGERAGCQDLLDRVLQVKPLLHLFGHIHEGYGTVRQGETWFVNGCNCAFGYAYIQPAHVFDWDGKAFRAVTNWHASQPLWEFLVQRCGPPVPVAAEQWKAAVQLEHAFWLEVAGEEIRFVAASDRDRVPGERQEDPLVRRWGLTFGVRIQDHWIWLLSDNPWEKLGDIPHLPEL
jgi:predicted phosphohydrolase